MISQPSDVSQAADAGKCSLIGIFRRDIHGYPDLFRIFPDPIYPLPVSSPLLKPSAESFPETGISGGTAPADPEKQKNVFRIRTVSGSWHGNQQKPVIVLFHRTDIRTDVKIVTSFIW